jgi:hypothetical protein
MSAIRYRTAAAPNPQSSQEICDPSKMTEGPADAADWAATGGGP